MSIAFILITAAICYITLAGIELRHGREKVARRWLVAAQLILCAAILALLKN